MRCFVARVEVIPSYKPCEAWRLLLRRRVYGSIATEVRMEIIFQHPGLKFEEVRGKPRLRPPPCCIGCQGR